MSVGGTASLDRQAIAQQSSRRGFATFYKYKSKYGGMEPSDAKRLRALEDENGKLKKLFAEQMLPSRDIAGQYPAGQRTTRCCETSIQKGGDARGKAECCGSPE